MSAVSIAELGRGINPAPGRRMLAMLWAYFDASKDQPPPLPIIAAVAGYLAPLAEWERVEQEWNAGLDYWDIETFHMSGLNRQLGTERANLCTLFFAHIITNSSLQAIGTALLSYDWDEPDWGEDNIVRLSSPYEQCLDLAFKIVGEHTKKHSPAERVAIVCCPDDTQEKIEAVFHRKQSEYPQLVTITIGQSGDIVPLQCADLGAGRLRHSWRAIAKNTKEGRALPFGSMPSGKGTHPHTSFWSLRPAAMIARAIRIAERDEERDA